MAHAALSPVGPPLCAWTQASRKFAIHLRPDVIGRLGTESWVAFKRVPRRGLEIGGILLGRTDCHDDVFTFWIEGFAPVESEHRSGPSYVLSESDFGHLQGELTKHGTSSIGIYRSQTRSEQLALQQPDVDLFERCFQASDALFLMLGPVPGKAALFFRAEGNLQCVHEFPLASSLSTIVTHRHSRPAPEISVIAAEPVPETRSAPTVVEHVAAGIATNIATHEGAPSRDPQRLIKTALKQKFSAGSKAAGKASAGNSSHAYSRWITTPGRWRVKLQGKREWTSSGVKQAAWMFTAVFAALIVAAAVRSDSSAGLVAPAWRTSENIRLSVERAGSSLRVLWDRNSSAMRGATRAVLHVRDGEFQSDRDLAPSEFAAGYVTYEPKNSDLTFRLDTYSAEPHATGLVQILNLSPPAAGSQVVPVAPNLKPAPKKQQPYSLLPAFISIARAEAVLANPAVQQHEAAKPVNEDAKEDIRSPAPRTPDRIETTSFDTRDTRDVSDARDAPAPKAAERPTQPTSIAEVRAVSVTDRQPSVRIITESVPPSRLGRVVGKVPLLRRLKKQDGFSEPVPVYRAQPLLQMPDRQSLIRSVAVDVKVQVAESGSVRSAEVLEFGDPTNLSLANAALAAARHWTFQPARIEDLPVSSEVVLHFTFNP